MKRTIAVITACTAASLAFAVGPAGAQTDTAATPRANVSSQAAIGAFLAADGCQVRKQVRPGTGLVSYGTRCLGPVIGQGKYRARGICKGKWIFSSWKYTVSVFTYGQWATVSCSKKLSSPGREEKAVR